MGEGGAGGALTTHSNGRGMSVAIGPIVDVQGSTYTIDSGRMGKEFYNQIDSDMSQCGAPY